MKLHGFSTARHLIDMESHDYYSLLQIDINGTIVPRGKPFVCTFVDHELKILSFEEYQKIPPSIEEYKRLKKEKAKAKKEERKKKLNNLRDSVFILNFASPFRAMAKLVKPCGTCIYGQRSSEEGILFPSLISLYSKAL